MYKRLPIAATPRELQRYHRLKPGMNVMTYAVHGAAGAQGAPIADLLTASGKKVVGLGRSSSTRQGHEIRAVDLNSVAELCAAYENVDGVFVHLPLGSPLQQLAYAQNIATAMLDTRPKRVVISTSGEVIDRPGTPVQRPPSSSLPTLIRALSDAGISLAVVAPRLFQENLLGPNILDDIKNEGVLRYPLSASLPVSWSSHIDVAHVVSALFERTDVTGVIGVGQDPALTGDQVARAFQKHLNKPVAYQAISPEIFSIKLASLIGQAAANGVASIYETFSTLDHHSINFENSAQKTLGIRPDSLDEWLSSVKI